jgi:hypothetical protein
MTVRNHFNAKKICERPEIFERKLLSKLSNELINKSRLISGENDIIHVN